VAALSTSTLEVGCLAGAVETARLANLW